MSLNFTRLQRLRPGYGYSIIPDETIENKIPDKDGIWLIDLDSDKSNLIIDFNNILKVISNHNWNNAEHYINHIFYNPPGEYCIFFHLWKNYLGFYNRVMLYEFKHSRLEVLDNQDLSACHYTFKNDYELLLTLRDKTGNIYYKIHNIKTKLIENLISSNLTSDSHPSYIDNDDIVIDSYLNYFRQIKLNVLNLRTNNIKRIYQGYHDLKFTDEYRCDLHPRLSPDKKMICIDTIENNNRIMKMIKL